MTTRPNILVITTHDLGRHIACYGQTHLNTPHLDAFFNRSTRFEQAFSVAPQCSPSRAAMFTGSYPQENGVMGLCNPVMGWDLNDPSQHIATHFKEADYQTLASGVIHETYGRPEALGFEQYWQENSTHNLPPAVDALFAKAASDPRPFYAQIGLFEPHRRPIDWSDKKQDQGFLHSDERPADPAGVSVPGYLADTAGTREELAEIQTAVEALDQTFGTILHSLESKGLAENTIIVFTTDHGLALPRAKCTLYDPGLEVALGIQIPGKKACIEPALYSGIDLAPTLLDLAGLPLPRRMQGVSWKTRLLNPDAKAPREQVFAGMTFHDYYFPCRAVRDARYKLIVHFSNTHAFMDCSQSWHHRSETLTPPNNNRSKSPLCELYDLKEDPWEQSNAAEEADMAEVRTRLLEDLSAHMTGTKDPLPAEGFPSPRHRAACKLLGLKDPD